jgi:putative DNA primase/helicase
VDFDTEASVPDFRFTDVGNGKRFVHLFGDIVRHCHPWRADLIWTGTHWQLDNTAAVERAAKEVVRSIYEQASEQTDEEQRKCLAKWATANEDMRRLRALINAARSERSIVILPEAMNTDPCLFNILNGTINLRTGQLQPHCKSDYITKIAPVEYDPGATCPIWDRCLQKWMGSNDDLISYLRRVCGYALTGSVKEECLWFLHGEGQNGKSTFLGALLNIMGDYGMQAIPEMLVHRSHEAHLTERADLFGRRFVSTIEVDEGKQIAEAILKTLTGGDKLRARFMYKDCFEFDPSHKIFLAANHQPVVTGMDVAVWRRIKLVPFEVTISPEERDNDLKDKLKGELPGILAWAVHGCLEWMRSGLGEPDEIRKATSEYQAEQDYCASFLYECCILNDQLKTKASVLLDAYQEWSGDKSMTAKAFSKLLNRKGYIGKHEKAGTFYYGIGLLG